MVQMTIPAELLTRLTAIKQSLIQNGSVVWRNDRDRRPSCRLRVRVLSDAGEVHHISIALPNGETGVAVERLIRDWRQDAARQKRESLARELLEDLELKMLAYQQVGTSRRKRRFIRRKLAEAKAGGPIAEWILVVSEGYRPPVRRAGRPRRPGFSALAGLLMPVDSASCQELQVPDLQCRGTKKPEIDQGFPEPSATPQGTQGFDFMAGLGVKLDWRWHKAVFLVSEHKAVADSSDRWLIAAVALVAHYRGEKLLSDVDYYVMQAHRLYERNVVERHRLEAALLTKEGDERVAEVCKLPVGLVEAYHNIFFDIKSVPPVVIAEWFAPDKRLITPEMQWKFSAWGGGMNALLELWRYQVQVTAAEQRNVGLKYPGTAN